MVKSCALPPPALRAPRPAQPPDPSSLGELLKKSGLFNEPVATTEKLAERIKPQAGKTSLSSEEWTGLQSQLSFDSIHVSALGEGTRHDGSGLSRLSETVTLGPVAFKITFDPKLDEAFRAPGGVQRGFLENDTDFPRATVRTGRGDFGPELSSEQIGALIQNLKDKPGAEQVVKSLELVKLNVERREKLPECPTTELAATPEWELLRSIVGEPEWVPEQNAWAYRISTDAVRSLMAEPEVAADPVKFLQVLLDTQGTHISTRQIATEEFAYLLGKRVGANPSAEERTLEVLKLLPHGKAQRVLETFEDGKRAGQPARPPRGSPAQP